MIDTEYIKDKKKTAKKLQRKLTTTMKKEKLDDLRGDIPTLDGIIIYTKNITALKNFDVGILHQSSTGQYGSKETLFGWHKDDEDRKTQAKLTAIILLSPTGSLMQIMTKSKLIYARQGTDLAFPSGLFH